MVYPSEIKVGQQLFLSDQSEAMPMYRGGPPPVDLTDLWIDVLDLRVMSRGDGVLVGFIAGDGLHRRVALPKDVQYRVRERQQDEVFDTVTRLRTDLLDWIDGKRSSSDFRMPPSEAPYLDPLVAIADAVRAVALSAAIVALSVPPDSPPAPASGSGPSADN